MKKIFELLVTILLLVSLASAGNVTIETDKKVYNQGEIVQFTIYNNNSTTLETDFKPSILNNTGKCVWGCYWAAVYIPIIVPSGENYSWTWDQKGGNGNVSPGIYRCMLGGYYSNEFEIATVESILVYYEGLGQDSNIVETNDLLKAADDWRNDTIPPGFSVPITTSQVLILADEWRNS